MAWCRLTSLGHFDSICTAWLWHRVMYDLCTRPDQAEPAPAHTEMESREDAEAPERQQQELRRSEEQVNTQHRLLDKAVLTPANVTSTSLLGKRHHSLYANLNGFEVEGLRKVSICFVHQYHSWWLTWKCLVPWHMWEVSNTPIQNFRKTVFWNPTNFVICICQAMTLGNLCWVSLFCIVLYSSSYVLKKS